MAVLQKRALLHSRAGEFGEARAAFEQMLQIAVTLGDRRLQGSMLVFRGIMEGIDARVSRHHGAFPP
jgi:hypothetical protein